MAVLIGGYAAAAVSLHGIFDGPIWMAPFYPLVVADDASGISCGHCGVGAGPVDYLGGLHDRHSLDGPVDFLGAWSGPGLSGAAGEQGQAGPPGVAGRCVGSKFDFSLRPAEEMEE